MNSFGTAIALLLSPLVFTHAIPTPFQPQSRQAAPVCSQWDLTPIAWNDAHVDDFLLEILENAKSSGKRFDEELGRSIGYDNFRCGVQPGSTCSVASCVEFDSATQYFAAAAVQNLNSMFTTMYNGVSLAQADASDLADDLADNFFHWKDPLYLGMAIAYAVDATVTAICTFGLGGPKLPKFHPRTVYNARGLQNVASGAGGVVAQFLAPLAGETRQSGIRKLDDMFFTYSLNASQALDNLADNIFSGRSDSNGNTVLQYLFGGVYLNPAVVPGQTEVRDFYRTSMFARTVNALYHEKKIYIISTTADLSALHDYPTESSWTDPASGRTFALYTYDKGTVQAPPGIDVLNGTLYNITARQLAESSGRAWQVAGNNYTDKVSKAQLLASFDSNGTLTPFQDQAGWEGMSNLPVCDVGERSEWVVRYGNKTIPCCCGPDCRDTYTFIQLANLNKTKDWYYQCKKQARSINFDFKDVNYGIDLGSSADRFWHNLGHGGRIGFTFGIVVAFVIVTWIILCKCCCRSRSKPSRHYTASSPVDLESFRGRGNLNARRQREDPFLYSESRRGQRVPTDFERLPMRARYRELSSSPIRSRREL